MMRARVGGGKGRRPFSRHSHGAGRLRRRSRAHVTLRVPTRRTRNGKAMTHGSFQVPIPVNEPVRAYAPGSRERASLKAELARQAGEVIEIPLVIDGEEIRTGKVERVTLPHAHQTQVALVHFAGAKEAALACEAASRARHD